MRLPLTRSMQQARSGRSSPPASVLAMMVFLLLVASAQHAAAQDAATSLGPVANVLSAPSWLLATGQDPRGLPGAGGSGWQGGGAATPVGAVTRQLGLLSASTAPSLASDPQDPNHLILAVDALDLPGVASYVSDDGGVSWQGPFQAPHLAGDRGGIGGAVVAFDRSGAAYLLSRSIGAEPVAGAGEAPRVRIIVSRSIDGGRTWQKPVIAASGASQSVAATGPQGEPLAHLTTRFLDAPTLAIGADPDDTSRDLLVVAFTELKLTSTGGKDAPADAAASPAVTSAIRLVRSGDGGQRWSESIAVSPEVNQETSAGQSQAPPLPSDLAGDAASPASPPGQNSQGNQVLQGPQAVFLSDGSLAISYLDTTSDGPQQGLAVARVARSTDGGRSFAAPIRAGVFHEIGERPGSAFFRWWDGAFPRLVAGPDNTLYLAVAARSASDPGDEGDIALFRSRDGGETWDVLQNPINAAAGAQFFPALAVAPDGALHLIWADMGHDPSGVKFAVNHAASHDQGDSWASENVAVTSGINTLIGSPHGRYLGNGLALATSAAQVTAAWPVTAQTASGGPAQQVAVAALPGDH